MTTTRKVHDAGGNCDQPFHGVQDGVDRFGVRHDHRHAGRERHEQCCTGKINHAVDEGSGDSFLSETTNLCETRPISPRRLTIPSTIVIAKNRAESSGSHHPTSHQIRETAALSRIAPEGTMENASSAKVKSTRPVTSASVVVRGSGAHASAWAHSASCALIPQRSA